MSPTPRPEKNTFRRGFGLVMLLNLIQIPLIPLTMGLTIIVLGVFQLFYVVPIAWRAHKRQEKARLQGVLTAAGVTFLVNGICDVVVLPKLKF